MNSHILSSSQLHSSHTGLRWIPRVSAPRPLHLLVAASGTPLWSWLPLQPCPHCPLSHQPSLTCFCKFLPQACPTTRPLSLLFHLEHPPSQGQLLPITSQHKRHFLREGFPAAQLEEQLSVPQCLITTIHFHLGIFPSFVTCLVSFS